MAGKKRSEKLGQPERVATNPPTERQRPRAGLPEIISACCPLCGHAIPQNRVTERIKGVTVETQPYFESIRWNPEQPFGVARSAAGKGSLADWHYINPEDAPELFQAIKTRFVNAVHEWVDRGWIKKSELK